MDSASSSTAERKRPRFSIGEAVRVRSGAPIGHCRTPHYFRGVLGWIERYCGAFPNPEELAYGRDGLPEVDLYRVQARMTDVWGNSLYVGRPQDTVVVEVFDHWLESLETSSSSQR